MKKSWKKHGKTFLQSLWEACTIDLVLVSRPKANDQRHEADVNVICDVFLYQPNNHAQSKDHTLFFPRSNGITSPKAVYIESFLE